MIWKASGIKAEYSISYADCFAAATALKYDATILTGDPEFKKIGSLVQVEWLQDWKQISNGKGENTVLMIS